MKEVCAAALLADFGPRHAFDRALAEALGRARDLLLDRIGGERGEDVAAARQDAEQGAKRGAAQYRRCDAAQILPARHEAAEVADRHVTLVLLLEIAQDLGDAEHADGDGDEVDAVGELEPAEREPLLAGVDVGADQPEQQPEHDHGERLEDRAVRERDRRDQAEDHEREVFGGAELEGDRGQRRREQHQDQGRDRAGKERAERGGGQRGTRAALPRHLVAVDRGHGRG